MATIVHSFIVGPGLPWIDNVYPGRTEADVITDLPKFYKPGTTLDNITFGFSLSPDTVDTGGVVVQLYPTGEWIQHDYYPGGGYWGTLANSFVFEGIGVAIGDTSYHSGYLLSHYYNTSILIGSDYDQSIKIDAHLTTVLSDANAPAPILTANLMINYNFHYIGYLTNGGDMLDFNQLGSSTKSAIDAIDLTSAIYEALGGDDTIKLPDVQNFALTGTVNWNPDATFFAGAGNDSVTGGNGADRIDGGAGNDKLDGGAGADWLIGGPGNDTVLVDAQADLVSEKPDEGVDVVIATTGFYLYPNIEQLTLAAGAGNIFGVGNAEANLLTGNEGLNLLIGGDGSDEIFGGGARDSLFGQSGDDRLFGDSGIDYIVAGDGGDTVNGGFDADEIYGEAGDDTLTGGSGFFTDIIVGGDGNDVIHGDSSLGDYDLLYGNVGDDTFYVDTPADIVFEQPGEGADTVYAGIIGAGFYLYGNIENLVLTGATPFGVGNALDNTMTGSGAANWLLGGSGNDTLAGKGGNDVLFGEAGADTFVFEAVTGADLVGDFEIGVDKIELVGGYASFDEAASHFIQDGTTGAIDLGGGNFAVFNNLAMSSLTAADFLIG